MLTHGTIEKVVRDRVKGRHADGRGLLLIVGASARPLGFSAFSMKGGGVM